MRAFARPGLGPDRWMAGIRPYLSPAAVEAYTGTDPANVPVHRVLGAGVLRSWTPQIARVTVRTDAGMYEVLLSRLDAATPWQVERAIPPA